MGNIIRSNEVLTYKAHTPRRIPKVDPPSILASKFLWCSLWNPMVNLLLDPPRHLGVHYSPTRQLGGLVRLRKYMKLDLLLYPAFQTSLIKEYT